MFNLTKRQNRGGGTLFIPIELTYIWPHMLKASKSKVLLTAKKICNRFARVQQLDSTIMMLTIGSALAMLVVATSVA